MLCMPHSPHLFNGNKNGPLAFMIGGNQKCSKYCLCVFPAVVSVPGPGRSGFGSPLSHNPAESSWPTVIYLFLNLIICKLNALMFSEHVTL